MTPSVCHLLFEKRGLLVPDIENQHRFKHFTTKVCVGVLCVLSLILGFYAHLTTQEPSSDYRSFTYMPEVMYGHNFMTIPTVDNM